MFNVVFLQYFYRKKIVEPFANSLFYSGSIFYRLFLFEKKITTPANPYYISQIWMYLDIFLVLDASVFVKGHMRRRDYLLLLIASLLG
jgi:hypothetical protein